MKRGFSLVEMMMALGISAIVMAITYTIAVTQMQSYTEGSAVAEMHSSARIVFESMSRDLRNAGAGTSFYAGAPLAALGASERLSVRDTVDGSSRGIPAIRIANNLTGPTGVMPGSDAISLLRILGASTWLEERVPPSPGLGTPFAVADFNVIRPCALADGMVLISDSSRSTSEAEAMVVALDRAASIAQSRLVFLNGYGINPADPARATNRSVPPAGMAAGSRVMCVVPVTYWLDDRGRLRLFRSTLTNPGGSAVAAGAYPGRVPIDPVNDAVLAEGIDDLQFAVLLSARATGILSNAWVFVPFVAPIAEAELAEARVVRASVLMRTAYTGDNNSGPNRIAAIEDHNLTQPKVVGCTTPATCYDPSYRRRLLTLSSGIRNMRLFDAVSDISRTPAQIRSYHE